MKECKIVQDLLELYMNDLTSNTTNEYIEKHLRICNKCKREFEKATKCIVKKQNECKIVYDLLPNYIEKLTSKTTNKYIEQHLKICNECNLVWSDMTAKFTIEDFEKLLF